ncbi:MAG: NACHT domain-containing protein [Bacteroidota bacterium]
MHSLNDYIDLDREFSQIDNSVDKDSAALASYLGSNKKAASYSWDELLEYRLVIILGEPGSGKTYELKAQNQKNKSAGKFSFFIRLEKLIDDHDVQSVFSDKEKKEFCEWLESDREATFFLDSVDESKLQTIRDFKKAVNNFQILVGGGNLRKSRFVISSRISEWRTEKDESIVGQLVSDIQKESVDERSRFKSNGSNVFSEGDQSFERKRKKETQIVQIDPLDKGRIKKFVEGLGLNKADKFIDDIEQAYAWELVRRPLDVEDIARYWQNSGQLGSLKEILENDIRIKLSETRERDLEDDISYQRLRKAVECLGAASTLSNILSINILGDDQDINSINTINPKDALPNDWSSIEIRKLLDRPIFTSATYGKLRFHHRRKAEYLTACWFENLFSANCDSHEICEYLFQRKGEALYVRNRIKPIIPWLAIGDAPWNKLIQNKALKAAPELFLKFGSPKSLDNAFKTRLLKALTDKFSDSSYIYDRYDIETISRLADEDLAPDIIKSLENAKVSISYKILLLRISFFGRLTKIVPTALNFIDEYSHDERIIDYSISIVGELGTLDQKGKVINKLLYENSIANSYVATVFEYYFPEVLKVDDLLQIIRKAPGVDEHTIGIDYSLKKIFGEKAAAIPTEILSRIVEGLSEIILGMPIESKYCSVPESYYWLGETLLVGFENFVYRNGHTSYSEVCAKAILAIDQLNSIGMLRGEISKSVLSKLNSLKSLRKSYAEIYSNYKISRGEKSSISYHLMFGFTSVLKKSRDDKDWLLECLSNKDDENFRPNAFRIAKSYWEMLGKPLLLKRSIEKSVDDKPNWVDELEISFVNWVKSKYNGWKHSKGIYNWGYWRDEKKRAIARLIFSTIYYLRLLINIRGISQGKSFGYLFELSRVATDNNSTLSSYDISLITNKYGKLISEVAVKGFMNYWRRFKPVLPHEMQDEGIQNGLFVGMKGIRLELERGSLNFKTLTDRDVELLIHYGLNELNAFPEWFKTLTHLHPEEVSEKVKIIINELSKNSVGGEGDLGKFLRRISSTEEYLIPIVKEYLLQKFEDDISLPELDASELFKIFKTDQLVLSKIVEKAEKKLKKVDLDTDTYSKWLAVLIRIDAEKAFKYLDQGLKGHDNKLLMEKTCSNLVASSSWFAEAKDENPDYLKPHNLKRLIQYVFKYIKPEDDIKRANNGAYTPNERDHAQRFRGSLLRNLENMEGRGYGIIIEELLKDDKLKESHEWLAHIYKSKNEHSVDIIEWEARDIPQLLSTCTKEPRNNYELYLLISRRLREIKNEVDGHATSSRDYVRVGDNEAQVRKFLKRELEDRANEQYTVPQEEEIDQRDQPDLRVHRQGLCPLPIEVKLADKQSYSGLYTGIKEQLLGKYLRSKDYRYGFYVVGYVGKDSWRDSNSVRYSYSELKSKLKSVAKDLLETAPYVEALEVVFIDFSPK